MSRSKSDLSCDAIENLGGLLRLALLGLFLGREVGRAEVALLRLALLGLLLGREVRCAEGALLRLALLGLLLGREVSRAEVALLRLALLSLLLGREVGRAEVALLHLALLGLLLGREVGRAEFGADSSLLFHLFLFLLGGQLIALDDAADRRSRVRRQAHRGEKAKRDGNCSALGDCVCPLETMHAGGSHSSELRTPNQHPFK